jgi:ATPase subunit of ABC transporter with duplicated ATPase domains
MPSLQVRRLSFAHGGAAPLFAGVDLHLVPGWYGLSGANGAGKSTLLRLLAGELAPEAGRVVLDPPGARVALAVQAVEEPGDAVLALASCLGEAAMRGRLGRNPSDLDRWASLSPGERKRWQIGAALAEDAAVLLLDEPTNHLDVEARELLLAALARFRGVGVVVSHDRVLLDALTTATIRIHAGAVTQYPGPYGAARALWEAEAARAAGVHERARAEERKAARTLADARRDRAAAEHRASSGNRMKNHRDHDARGGLTKGRIAGAEARLGREVGTRRAALERAEAQVAATPFAPDRTVGRSVFAGYARAPSARVLALDAAEVRSGERLLLRDVHLALGRADRVSLSGENGAGKSTLVRAILRASAPPRGRVLHLPQDLSAEEARAVVGEIRALPSAEKGRVLSVVDALGIDPDRLLASPHPSPGEARKACIALGLGNHAWALVLDEPENHLDLPSIERLEAALAAFPGALLLVTHDEALARRCTSEVWRVARERVEAGRKVERADHGVSV